MLDRRERWRLILGEASEGVLGAGSEPCQACDAALSWLYNREEDLNRRGVRQSGKGGSTLSVPDWIDSVHRLFPKATIERLEQDAVERFAINELVTNPAVLERVEPNPALLKAVLRTQHLMNPEVLALARKLVAQVVEQLMEQMRKEVRTSFGGSLDRRRSSLYKVARNFDFKTTLRRNLKNLHGGKLVIEKPYFFSRVRRFTEEWQIVLLVDQSGSMVDSVIHSAVTAACLWSLPGIRAHLCVFDTEVVDLTEHCQDPVETLMKVQLGGGTNIARAVDYGASLIRAPRRSIVVLITDFYEGGHPSRLVQQVRWLVSQGTVVVGLAALDREANPDYDRRLAARLAEVGAHVGAMTPGELAGFLAEKVGQ